MSTISPYKPFFPAPVPLQEAEFAMELGIKEDTAQYFNLSLQAPFLILKVLCLKNTDNNQPLGRSLVYCVQLDTPTPNLVLATANVL